MYVYACTALGAAQRHPTTLVNSCPHVAARRKMNLSDAWEIRQHPWNPFEQSSHPWKLSSKGWGGDRLARSHSEPVHATGTCTPLASRGGHARDETRHSKGRWASTPEELGTFEMCPLDWSIQCRWELHQCTTHLPTHPSPPLRLPCAGCSQ
jgi:hypothetical protein